MVYKVAEDFLWFKQGDLIEQVEDAWIRKGHVVKVESKKEEPKEESKPVKKVTKKTKK